MKIQVFKAGEEPPMGDVLPSKAPAMGQFPEGSVQSWAEKKGHVPPPPKRRGEVHRGPHIDVVLAHTRWPRNKPVSEAEYDAAVIAAYSVPLTESQFKSRPLPKRRGR